jgi:hypothetical protein
MAALRVAVTKIESACHDPFVLAGVVGVLERVSQSDPHMCHWVASHHATQEAGFAAIREVEGTGKKTKHGTSH